MDIDQSILGSICQHGSVHLSTLSIEADRMFLEAKKETSFIDGSGKNVILLFPNRHGLPTGKHWSDFVFRSCQDSNPYNDGLQRFNVPSINLKIVNPLLLIETGIKL